MKTIKRLVLASILAVISATPAAAQNRIDELTDKFSTFGNSNYTSVVARNPKTKKVEKVVKELTIYNSISQAHKQYERAFLEEGKNDNLLINLNQNTDKHSMILTVKELQYTCVYMMRGVDGNCSKGIIITIIKTIK